MSDVWLDALRRERDGYAAVGQESRAAEVQEQIDLIVGAAAGRAADPPKAAKRGRQTRRG